MKLLANSLAAGIGTLVGNQVSLRVGQQRNPHPMPHQFSPLLEHSMRMRYRDPVETLGLFGFTAGSTVLDLGCGTGVFTVEMARMVGPNGTVHGVDIQQPLVDATHARIDAAGLTDRVNLHCSGAYDLPLPDESCDLAVLIATLGEIPNRYAALCEVRRVLKPGGRLAIGEELPDPAYLTARTVRAWAEDAGFVFMGKSGNPFCYNMIFANGEFPQSMS